MTPLCVSILLCYCLLKYDHGESWFLIGCQVSYMGGHPNHTDREKILGALLLKKRKPAKATELM